ncbi:MAG: TIM barrel protein [Candidatus Calescibacterium sp.]|nr:TIM barrel protein [Candidatus Calescibacterium sp.]MCX7971828.1 TIM barrel protein [bacterium]MDW8194943.1 TIM barrel protein [Candidatus Calescibacterium sp.]
MLLFGTAGIPNSAKKDTFSGIMRLRELGLQAMELEFVHGIKISHISAQKINTFSNKNNITLSSHAPYYINLNSLDKEKVEASINRIIKTAEISQLCGARNIVVHPGYYHNMDKLETYNNIKKALKRVLQEIQGYNVTIRIETMGKQSQFGSLEEVLNLSQDLGPQIMPCIDFAHLHARTVGKLNTYQEFCQIIDNIQHKLGKKSIKDLHIHISGIKYSEKGELYHLNLKESDFNYIDFIKSLKDLEVEGIVICESPNLEDDAIMLKELYYS